MTKHHCHAPGCKAACLPKHLFCPTHWAKLPEDLKAAIFEVYVPGQEKTKNPTMSYCVVQRVCCAFVALCDGEDAEVARMMNSADLFMRFAGKRGEAESHPRAFKIAQEMHGKLRHFLTSDIAQVG